MTDKLFLPAAFSMLLITAALPARGDEPTPTDRQRIAGTWQVVALVADGNPAAEVDARKLQVENGDDGSWIIYSEGREISRGSSDFDEAKAPKTIDFTPTSGAGLGTEYHGIYELGPKRRRLCFVPAHKERPTEFVSRPGSEVVLVTFERVERP